ncbi:MAG TPA: CBS domain-containing protein [Stellaceae bacterium]|nr:CBS domain-containing protein [Stellaceae bacterium]
MDTAEVMSRRVVTVTPETAVIEAARLMLQHRVSGLPVVDEGGAVIGIVTEGDLLRRAETGTARRRSHWLELLIGPARLARDYVQAHARTVGEVMTRKILWATPHTPLAEVVQLMERHHVKRLPVIEGGSLVGIVSRADLVRALVDMAERPASRDYNDADIREHILAAIAAEPWGPRFDISVWVKNGIVDLGGTYTNEDERAALKVLAETAPGVKAVRDRLVWVEPVSGTVLPPAGSPPTIG